MNDVKMRIKWIDTAKGMAIFLVYLWHLGEIIGPAFNFILWFHVPLFFFLSGCTENFNMEENVINNFKKYVKSLLIPTCLFTALSVCVYIVINTVIKQETSLDLKPVFIQIAKGIIRNNFFAFSLWFFTCLFVVKVMFSVIKLIKIKFLIVAVGVCMYLAANYAMHPNPIFEPHMYYNVDSAFLYMIYYVSGFVLYPYIEKVFQMDSSKNRILVNLAGAGSFIYSVFLFLGFDLFKLGGVCKT